MNLSRTARERPRFRLDRRRAILPGEPAWRDQSRLRHSSTPFTREHRLAEAHAGGRGGCRPRRPLRHRRRHLRPDRGSGRRARRSKPYSGTNGSSVGSRCNIRGAVPIRVVLADDSLAVRDVLAQILNRSPDIDLVASAHDEPTLLAAIEETRPDVVVTDVRMPPTGTDEGLRVAERLATSQPG